MDHSSGILRKFVTVLLFLAEMQSSIDLLSEKNKLFVGEMVQLREENLKLCGEVAMLREENRMLRSEIEALNRNLLTGSRRELT